MARKRDFKDKKELEDYVIREAWSDSEDEGDFSCDDSDIDPDFDFEKALRLEQFDDDDLFDAHIPGNRSAADAEDDAAVLNVTSNASNNETSALNAGKTRMFFFFYFALFVE